MTCFRNPVSAEQCIAVTFWRLATNVELRKISALFGLGQSTVSKIVNETCKAITTHLSNNFGVSLKDNSWVKILKV